eukprot:1152641-Pelagomonas_calceolata.AAC.7
MILPPPRANHRGTKKHLEHLPPQQLLDVPHDDDVRNLTQSWGKFQPARHNDDGQHLPAPAAAVAPGCLSRRWWPPPLHSLPPPGHHSPVGPRR